MVLGLTTATSKNKTKITWIATKSRKIHRFFKNYGQVGNTSNSSAKVPTRPQYKTPRKAAGTLIILNKSTIFYTAFLVRGD